jgi:hypothetical protein
MDGGFRLPSFTFWQRFFRLMLFIYLVWLVRGDLYIIIEGLRDFFGNGYVMSSQLFNSSAGLFERFCIFAIIYLVYIFWFAQFILPVTSLSDRRTAFLRLLLFGISGGRWHGPAVFVRDGAILGNTNEIEKNWPGVAFVDLRSAITLDKHLKKKSDLSPASLEMPQKLHFDLKSKSYVSGIRVAGPGLTFIGKNEKITGTVDLRSQNRSRKGVYADTRDGIRVKTDVSCSFTISQPPEILDVCLGGENMSQVLVIEWDNTLPLQYKQVKRLSKELDEGDAKEIYTFIVTHPDPSAVQSDISNSQFPFTFDSKRVEQAIYSETTVQDPSTQNSLLFKKWSDWPQDVAAEKFRILLAKWPYMNLYTPEDPINFPLKDFKRELLKQVRNTGILAFRVVALRNGKDLQKGQTYRTSDLIFYPPRNLTRFDILRCRGIKVLSAGFGELEPKEKDVRNRMMESWKSAKQKEADMKSADYNLEVARVKNQARVRTQQSMIYHLTQLLENQEYPREALALLIYQELEAAAANPETRRLLPEDTLSLLTGIGTILLPNEKSAGKPTGGLPLVPHGEGDQ